MKLREAYQESLVSHGHTRDPAQEHVVELLVELQRELLLSQPGLVRRWLQRLLRRRIADTPRGLYLWGGVGRGKTFLMDLFFETLPLRRKKRIHFHRMMHEVHAAMAGLDNVADPLDRVAADIAARTRVLCFDEFFVSDIGDAMILGRLLDGLFSRGVVLVATSNAAPQDLYRDGLQRQRFLPAIELLNTCTRVVHMQGEVDYRLRLLQQAGTYLTPDDTAAQRALQHYFDETASSRLSSGQAIPVNGRDIDTCRLAKGIAWFEFAQICDGPRSQNDYIEIARWYPTVIVSGIPLLDRNNEDQARRLIALVDEFYDRRVKLLVSAAAPIGELYRGERLRFEFERTASRLIEMQSTEYLASPHLA